MGVVLDSSTLILLAKITLLRDVTVHVEGIVTETVRTEATRRKELMDAKLIQQLVEESKLLVEEVEPPGSLAQEFNLDVGEASAIQLAREDEHLLATDDKAAMNACKVFGTPFVTAIHFVLQAHEAGTISSEAARTKIQALDEHGRYDARILEHARERIGDDDE